MTCRVFVPAVPLWNADVAFIYLMYVPHMRTHTREDTCHPSHLFRDLKYISCPSASGLTKCHPVSAKKVAADTLNNGLDSLSTAPSQASLRIKSIRPDRMPH